MLLEIEACDPKSSYVLRTDADLRIRMDGMVKVE